MSISIRYDPLTGMMSCRCIPCDVAIQLSDIPNHRSSEQHQSRCPEDRTGALPPPPVARLPQSQTKQENPRQNRRRKGRRIWTSQTATPATSSPDSSSSNNPTPPNLTAFLDDPNLIPNTGNGSGKYDSDTSNTLAPLHSSASQDVDAYSTDGWFHPMNTMQNAYFVTGVHPSGGPLSNLSGHWASFSFFIICFFLIPLVFFIVVHISKAISVPGSGAI